MDSTFIVRDHIGLILTVEINYMTRNNSRWESSRIRRYFRNRSRENR